MPRIDSWSRSLTMLAKLGVGKQHQKIIDKQGRIIFKGLLNVLVFVFWGYEADDTEHI